MVQYMCMRCAHLCVCACAFVMYSIWHKTFKVLDTCLSVSISISLSLTQKHTHTHTHSCWVGTRFVNRSTHVPTKQRERERQRGGGESSRGEIWFSSDMPAVILSYRATHSRCGSGVSGVFHGLTHTHSFEECKKAASVRTHLRSAHSLRAPWRFE